MAPETLGVDTEMLSRFGSELVTVASQIPQMPSPLTLSGGDAISAAIMARMPELETPIQTGLAEVKAAATKTANNIVAAAERYAQTDEQLARAIEAAGEPTAGGGAVDGAGSGAAGHVQSVAATGAGGAAGSTGSPAGSMGQVGSMMSTPMQMAGQVAQMPMQAMGMAASVPQSAMQGVQQVSQMAGGLGDDRGDSAGQGDAQRRDESLAADRAQAGDAPGQSSADRPLVQPIPEHEPAQQPVPDDGGKHPTPETFDPTSL